MLTLVDDVKNFNTNKLVELPVGVDKQEVTNIMATLSPEEASGHGLWDGNPDQLKSRKLSTTEIHASITILLTIGQLFEQIELFFPCTTQTNPSKKPFQIEQIQLGNTGNFFYIQTIFPHKNCTS